MAEFRHIPLSLIDDPQAPARMQPDDPDILGLAESIAGVGLINPITVRPRGDRYEVVAGHRRLLACRAIGYDPVPCIVQEDDDEMANKAMLAENVARKDLSPIEEACMLKELQDQYGYGYRTLCKVTGRSQGWIQLRLKLLEMPPDIQKAVHEGIIPVNTAMELAKVEDEATRREWTVRVHREGVAARTVKMWVEAYHASQLDEATAQAVEAASLIEEREQPKGQCWICKGRYTYDRLKAVLVCGYCYLELLKAMQGGAHSVRDHFGPDGGGAGDAGEGGAEAGEAGGQGGDTVRRAEEGVS